MIAEGNGRTDTDIYQIDTGMLVNPVMMAVGDRDIRQAVRYLKRRDDRLVEAFEALERQLTSNVQAAAVSAVVGGGLSVGETILPRQDSNLRPAD